MYSILRRTKFAKSPKLLVQDSPSSKLQRKFSELYFEFYFPIFQDGMRKAVRDEVWVRSTWVTLFCRQMESMCQCRLLTVIEEENLKIDNEKYKSELYK
jgi:hypothetical protein